jgi:hypothetical protein
VTAILSCIESSPVNGKGTPRALHLPTAQRMTPQSLAAGRAEEEDGGGARGTGIAQRFVLSSRH